MRGKYLVKQVDFKDCGACCMLSIIKYFNGYVPLEKLKIDSCTSSNGTTAFHIIETLKKYGFDAIGLKLNFEYLICDKINLPVIAHVTIYEKYDHFVVIYKIDKRKKKIHIMDPAYGNRAISYDEWKNIWNNFVIIVTPISIIPKITNTNTILKILVNLFFQYKSLLIKIILISILFMGCNIFTSFYFKLAVNAIDNSTNFILFKISVVLFLIIYVLKILLQSIRNYLENFLNKNIDIKLFIPYLNHIFYLPSNYAKSKTPGEIITRVSELNEIKTLFSKIFISLFLDLLLAFITFFVIYRLNNKIFIIILFIILFYIFITFIFNKFIQKKLQENILYETDFNSKLIEGINSLETIKNNNYEKKYMEKIEYSFIKYLKHNFTFNHLLNIQNAFQNFIIEIGLFIILTLGLYLYLKNELVIVDLITINFLIFYIFEPLKNLAVTIPKISFIKFVFRKLSDFYNVPCENLNPKNEAFLNGDIEFKNITFTYNNYNNILSNFSLKINKNEKIMIKGKSGGGKSTFCKLLYRLIKPKKGNIIVNNINILDYSLETIRKNITYLSQKENIFSDTIKNNIDLEQKLTLEQLNKIIKICRIDKIIDNKPLRLDTFLAENGINLSGGERQRILLARALARDNNIIILDEALSEVDKELEKAIIKDLLEFLNNKTLIYVCHRDMDKLFEKVIRIGDDKLA